MRELGLFIGLQQLLLEADPAPDWAPEIQEAPFDRVSSLGQDFLALGISLRGELADPNGFLRLAAATSTEVARLAAPPGTSAAGAIDRLAAHQRNRLAGRSSEAWRARGPEAHLSHAFWQLCGLAFEITEGSTRDGSLEQHAADCANYLLFTVLTSAAWSLPHRDSGPEPQAPDPSCRRGNSPASESP